MRAAIVQFVVGLVAGIMSGLAIAAPALLYAFDYIG